MVASLAPPWSGPLRAPMAPVMAEWMSARVAAMTRAAKVLALSSWSAWRMSAMSKVRVAVSEGFSPLSIQRKLAACERDWSASTTDLPLRMRSKRATIMAICAVRRKDLRTLASWELSASSGS